MTRSHQIAAALALCVAALSAQAASAVFVGTPDGQKAVRDSVSGAARASYSETAAPSGTLPAGLSAAGQEEPADAGRFVSDAVVMLLAGFGAAAFIALRLKTHR